MKAMVIREFGPPSVMKMEEVPDPEPGPGEVVIEVHAVSVNRTLDLVVRAGNYERPVALPHVLGVDPSGIVVAVGEGVTTPKIGDRVATSSTFRTNQPELRFKGIANINMLGVTCWGGYAEKVKLPAQNTYPIPDGLDFPTATVITRHFPMAYMLIRDRGQVKKDDWVLVMGAAGGLGVCCIQVAKNLGAKVIGAAGADERVKLALELGADYGVNYRTQDLEAECQRITEGQGVNVVAENIADPTIWDGAFNSLTRNGRLVTAGAHGGGKVTLDVNRLYLRQISILGGTGSTRDDYISSLKDAAAGKLKAPIDDIMPLSKAVEAHEIVDARDTLGKIVLDPTLD